MFSRRVPDDLVPNALAAACETHGPPRFDLTASNPTLCDLPYPTELLDALSDASGLIYRPDPFGLARAREAVAALYRDRGVAIEPGQILLTASTSESYSYLFKLLADPGDVVLTPAPSYPLLAHLAELEGLQTRTYRLDPHESWQPDLQSIDWTGVRALLSVHPNNPSGSWVEPATADEIEVRCAAASASWIVDEVFLDYPLGDRGLPASMAGRERALTFVLGGLSKSVGLPQLKLGWIVVSGPRAMAAAALEKLEFIADQYLSPSTPVQLALPQLLERGTVVRRAILERCRTNLVVLTAAVRRIPAIGLYPPDGGWSAVLRFPSVLDEQSLAIRLIEGEGVAVYPGYLFDFARPGHLVISLLPPQRIFKEGLRRLLATMDGAIGPPAGPA